MARAIVVPPGEGHRVGNIDFLARSVHTGSFNLGIITMQPHRHGPEPHVHHEEDDAFYILDGELVFTVEGERVVAGPGTFILVPPEVEHDFANESDAVARMLNIHAPAGFDLRVEQD